MGAANIETIANLATDDACPWADPPLLAGLILAAEVAQVLTTAASKPYPSDRGNRAL